METLRQLLPLLGPWLIASAGLVLWVRYWPLRLRLKNDAAWPTDTVSREALTRAGDLLTALMHAQEGWQELHMAPIGRESVGRVFVRNRLGPALYEVRFVETKCVLDPAAEGGLATVRVGNSFAALTSNELAAANEFANAVVRAIRWNSARVEKFLYLHTLPGGTTRIYRVTPDGHVAPQETALISGNAHKSMCRLLAFEFADEPMKRAAEVEHHEENSRRVDAAA